MLINNQFIALFEPKAFKTQLATVLDRQYWPEWLA
jgi:hypothetical protein